MSLSNPLVSLSSCQDIGNLPMTHLLGSTKTWACNCLRVIGINDRDKNNLKNEFHGKMRGIEMMSRGGSGCSARASQTPSTAIKHSNDRVFAYIRSDVMITGTISKEELIKVAESMVAQKATTAYSRVH